MPRKAASAEQLDDTRRRIVEAARTVAARDGLDCVTLRQVARLSGFSASALYRYFPSRPALMRAMWQDTLDEFQAAAALAVAGAGAPLRRVRAFLEEYARFAERRPEGFRATFMTLWTDDPERLIVADPTKGSAYVLLREATAAAVRAGLFAEADVDLLAQTLWATVHGAVALEINFGDFPLRPRVERIDMAISACVAGLRVKHSAGTKQT